ncbi:hypothetical protein [Acetobacter senegalensis]|uniref:hypothetical protein n=1 Tax=Acetobacter senegalensis TaxID=446692 RepID=UPI00264FC8DE|nr:hypothetical protein [Acetobacter senegalensis]MDN7351093.1 hypothetical protein [Acetobacter senegalensis]
MTKQTTRTLLLAAGVCIMTSSLQPRQAYGWGEAAVVAAIKALQQFTGKQMDKVGDNITNSLNDMTNPHSVSSMIRDAATQQANYAKGQVAAQSRIADAQNTAMAAFLRRQQETGIRDEHMMSPEFCSGLDSQQATMAAAKASRTALGAITTIVEPRGEAAKGTPSYYGRAQGVDANTVFHLRRYCSQEDVDAGLCSSVSRLPNADQRASTLFMSDTLSSDGAVDAANDYSTSLIQPVAPAAIRGEQASSTMGREQMIQRRSYNARMSLARFILAFITALETPSVSLTADQKKEMQAEGLQPLDRASWLQAMSLEVNRRVSSVSWNASLQAMPTASVLREIATELAQSNYLAMQNYRLGLYQASVGATGIAQTEEAHMQHASNKMPSPTINP